MKASIFLILLMLFGFMLFIFATSGIFRELYLILGTICVVCVYLLENAIYED